MRRMRLRRIRWRRGEVGLAGIIFEDWLYMFKCSKTATERTNRIARKVRAVMWARLSSQRRLRRNIRRIIREQQHTINQLKARG